MPGARNTGADARVVAIVKQIREVFGPEQVEITVMTLSRKTLEGSTLKSTFANALTLFFCEASGIMAKQGKPCIAYGSEVGAMEPFLEHFASKICRDTYFITRTEES